MNDGRGILARVERFVRDTVLPFERDFRRTAHYLLGKAASAEQKAFRLAEIFRGNRVRMIRGTAPSADAATMFARMDMLAAIAREAAERAR